MSQYELPPEREPESWDQYDSKFLVGDLVKTEFGSAIVKEANRNSYSLINLPDCLWRVEEWGWIPPKTAWYKDDELELIEKGAMSKMRDQL